MITITGRRSKHFQNNTTTNTILYSDGNTGSAPKAGDWIMAIISGQSSLVTSFTPVIPSDFSWLVPPFTPGSGTTYFGLAAKQFKSGDPQSTSFGASGTSTNGYNLTLVWGEGAVNPTDWKVGTRWVRNGGSTLLMRSPSITTTVAGSTVIAFAGERTLAPETDDQVTVENMPEWFSIPHGDQYISLAYQMFPAAGTATQEVTTRVPNGHAQNGYGFQIEAPPTLSLPPEPPAPSGVKVRTVSLNGYTETSLKVSWGGQLITPSPKQIKHGYSSVNTMLSQQQFYVAHRGGSRDFPEMSKYSYGQSVLMGYGALELSLARTIDGVWFGLHDDSIDRTSGIATGKTAAQMTWAEVQQYQILGSVAGGNPTQPNRPYMRWEELMELYYPSHVIYVDPKAAMGFRAELFDMMDAMHGTPTDKFVGKYYGVVGGNPQGATSFPMQLEQRGYHRWGYFYQADAANFAAYAPRWSILGMEHGADQATWDAIKSYGKPVMGHIPAGQAAVDSARSKGANGYMIAGVKGVTRFNDIPMR